MKTGNCNDPKCPIKVPPAEERDPDCICNKPLYIVIPAGGHIHCPAHPWRVVFGPGYTL